MYNYIGILKKSSAINNSLKCHFTSSKTTNLILSKNNIIEIYNLTKNGLESSPYIPIFGKILLLENIPSLTEKDKDNLFILTEDFDYALISSNENKIKNLINGSIKEDIGKKQDEILYDLDLKKNFMLISVYQNIFHIICLNTQLRNNHRDFKINYDYENLLFLKTFNYDILNNENNNNKENLIFTFCIIKTSVIYPENNNNNIISTDYSQNEENENNKNSNIEEEINFETIQLDVENQKIFFYSDKNNQYLNINPDFKKYLHKINLNQNPTISMMIVNSKGIIFLFYSNYLTFYYYDKNSSSFKNSHKTKPYDDRKFINYTVISEESIKYFITDEKGNLFLLTLLNYNINQFNHNTNLILQYLGTVNYSSTLTYLDNGYLFVGSIKANSQLVKIINKEPFLIIEDEYESLAPISDFVVVNNSKEENSIEILTVSGMEKSCSIKFIKKGTSVNFEGGVEIKGIKNVFKFYYKDNNKMDIEKIDKNIFNNFFNECLVISTIKNSFVLNYKKNKISINNKIKFDENEINLFTTNLLNCNNILFITNKNIYLYNSSLIKIFTLELQSIPLIIKFHQKTSNLFIFDNKNKLIKYSLIEDKNKIELKEIIFENIFISSFDVSQYFLIYSLWNNNNLFIYTLYNENLDKKEKNNLLCSIDENVNYIQISNIQIFKKDGIKFFFVSLSNGKMLYYKLKQQFRNVPNYIFKKEDFVIKRKYNIINESFSIKKLKLLNGESNLFLNTPTPSFIYITNENLKISNFNIKNCNDLIEIEENKYLFIFNNSISFGSLSNTQSQNVQTKKIEKTIHNIQIINFDSNKNINFIGMLIEEKEINNKKKSKFLFCDINLKELSSFKLEYENEISLSFSQLLNLHKTSNQKFIIIGSALIENESQEPISGHLYLLNINGDNNYNIKKLSEIKTIGGIYKVINKNNLIFVSIANNLLIYNLIENVEKNVYEFILLKKINDFILINDLSIFNENELVICDINRSITLFNFNQEENKLNEICRDYDLSWIYGNSQCGSNIQYVTDIDGNIITLFKTKNPTNDEEKYKFGRKAYFNYGERINKMITTKIKANYLKEICFNNLDNNNNSNVNINNNNSSNNNNNNDNNNNNVDNDEIEIIYFGTLEGSIGIIIQLNKEIFDFLNKLENLILTKTISNGNFDYKKWRSYKDGFRIKEKKGFIEGNIIEDFLNYDDEYRREIIKELNYPWKKDINDIINIIETLVKYH